jgi:hypothetical protein
MPEVETAFYSPANSQSAMVRFPPSTDIPHDRFRAPPPPVTRVRDSGLSSPTDPGESRGEIGDGTSPSRGLPEIAKRLSGRRVAIARGLTRLPDRG